MGAASATPAEYRAQVEAWRAHREAGLRAHDGWLTLAGLFWLKPGDNTIGAGETNDFLLPRDSAPPALGVLRLSGKQVTFTSMVGGAATVNGKPVSGTVVLHYDANDNSDIVGAGSISFYVIERNSRLAIRAKNFNSPALRAFQGTTFFPVNPAFRFEAKFIPDSKKIEVPDVLGATELQESPGIVEFALNGHDYKLRPVYEDNTLFFIFRDLTSKKETYQAGRMLNTPLPVDGKVILDFNQAYNPPCAFTPYATCPLPPKGNVLPVRIEAGELRYGAGEKELAPDSASGGG